MWFPDWPIQRLRAEPPEREERPLVLSAERASHGSFVVHASAAAEQQGVRKGMPLAEAQGVLGTDSRAEFLQHDPAGDWEGLVELARVCHQFTPQVAIEDSSTPESLLLDIAGCLRLFGSEEQLIQSVREHLRQRSLTVRTAVADTIGCAWALARFGSRSTAMRSLPIEALRLPTEAAGRLRRLGLVSVGALLDLPRATIPSRFGSMVLERIDQFTGRRPEVLPLVEPLDPVEAIWTTEDPIGSQTTLRMMLQSLLEQVMEELARRRRAALRVTCRFLQASIALAVESPEVSELTLSLTRPTTSVAHLQELVSLQLERMSWTGDVTTVLVIAEPVPFPPLRERTLFEIEGTESEEWRLASLLDRLLSRCGEQAIRFPDLVDDWVPERSVAFRPQRLEGSRFSRPTGNTGPEPLRRYPVPQPIDVVAHQDRPVRLRWGRFEERVVDCLGPQRIEAGWWRRSFVRRDEFLVLTASGRRLWLSRTRPEPVWYLCGE